MRAQAALVEIVERHPGGGSLPVGTPIKPNEIRINGIPLLCPKDQTIKVHEIDLDGDVVQVTLTLFARRVVIAEEPIEENQS